MVTLGVLGIAAAILAELQRAAAEERHYWYNVHAKAEDEISRLRRQVEQELRRAQQRQADFQRLTQLHFESAQAADRAYDLLRKAQTSLDALNQAIRKARVERDRLIAEKRQAQSHDEKARYEQEIGALQELRRQLFPDKDQLKAERDALLGQVRRLNAQTHSLKTTIRDRCGTHGQDWHKRLVTRTDRRRRGLPPEPRVRGTVKWFDESKGFGFIRPATGGEDIYINRKHLKGVYSLREGDRVEFSVRRGDKGPWAFDARKV